MELTSLLRAFGQRLAEELAAQSSLILQSAAAAQDALLAGQSRRMVKVHEYQSWGWKVAPGRKWLDRQSSKATLAQLNTLARCLAFRTALAQVSWPLISTMQARHPALCGCMSAARCDCAWRWELLTRCHDAAVQATHLQCCACRLSQLLSCSHPRRARAQPWSSCPL